MSEKKEADLFEKFGLSLSSQSVTVGNTYPIYGMITRFFEKEDDGIQVEINFSIKAKMLVDDENKIEVLKDRAFEPGIFISTVLDATPEAIAVACKTVVFGKKHAVAAA